MLVAAFRNFHVGVVSAGGYDTLFPVNRRGADILKIIFGPACQGFVHAFCNFVNRHGADDGIHTRNFLLDFFFVALCQTAGSNKDFNHALFLQLLHFQKGVDAFFLGIPDKAAGVYHHHIGFRFIVRKGITLFRKLSQHHLRVHQVLIAP